MRAVFACFPPFLPALLAGCLLIGLPAAAQEKPIGVVSVSVETDLFHDRIEALGTLRANESVALTVNVTETITAIHFEDNQRVQAGDILVEMTSAEERALLEEARSTLREAKQQYRRISTLEEQGNAPSALLDQRRRESETAQARLSAVQSRLKDRLVVAPFAGVVGLRDISVGALVEPGDVITTLDDDTQMKLDFSVPAIYLADLRPGLPVTAHSRAYDKPFEGTIRSIDSRIDPLTRAVQVRAILPNPDHLLRPGLLMQVVIRANARKALVIPEAALVPEGEKQFVFRIDKGDEDDTWIARKTELSIGARRPGEVEVLSGLSEGERIVTHGTLKLRDGAPVTLQESAF